MVVFHLKRNATWKVHTQWYTCGIRNESELQNLRVHMIAANSLRLGTRHLEAGSLISWYARPPSLGMIWKAASISDTDSERFFFGLFIFKLAADQSNSRI